MHHYFVCRFLLPIELKTPPADAFTVHPLSPSLNPFKYTNSVSESFQPLELPERKKQFGFMSVMHESKCIYLSKIQNQMC
jgi:hypothetical protein